WSASGGSVASSTSGKRHYGHYQNASCGAFKVVATSHPGDLSDTANVTVAGCTVPVASVTVSPGAPTVQVGQTTQLTATPKDANGTPLTGRVVTWSSDNTAVAMVDGSGLVTAVAAGSATITASSEGRCGAPGGCWALGAPSALLETTQRPPAGGAAERRVRRVGGGGARPGNTAAGAGGGGGGLVTGGAAAWATIS